LNKMMHEKLMRTIQKNLVDNQDDD
jgi:hypothetical protein